MDSFLGTMLLGIVASVLSALAGLIAQYLTSTRRGRKREIMIRSKKTGDSITLEVGPGPMTAEQHEALREAMDELTRRDSANRPATA